MSNNQETEDDQNDDVDTMIEPYKGAPSVSIRSGTRPPRSPATNVRPTTTLYAFRKPREKKLEIDAENEAAVQV